MKSKKSNPFSEGKLTRVNHIRAAQRSLGVGKDYPVGTKFIFNYCDGALTMQPDIPNSFGITTSGLRCIHEYLVRVFGEKWRGAIPELVDKAMSALSHYEVSNTYESLYNISEAIYREWYHNKSGALRALIPKAIGVGSVSKRKPFWDEVWAYAVEQSQMDSNTVHRYKGSHSNEIIIPPRIWEKTGLGDAIVSVVLRDDGTFLIRKAKESEMEFLYQRKTITKSGIVHGTRYVYLNKTHRQFLDPKGVIYTTGVDLKFTIDIFGTGIITVERPTEEELKTLKRLPAAPTDEYYRKERTVLRHVNGPIILPSAYCRAYNLDRNDALRTVMRNGKMYIYPKNTECDICGDTYQKGAGKSALLCPDCADDIDSARDFIKNHGGVEESVGAVKSVLLDALARIKSYEEK